MKVIAAAFKINLIRFSAMNIGIAMVIGNSVFYVCECFMILYKINPKHLCFLSFSFYPDTADNM